MSAVTAQSGRIVSRQFSEKNEKGNALETSQNNEQVSEEPTPRKKLDYCRNPSGRIRFSPRRGCQ